MTRRPIRWWATRAFGRSPLLRTSDRVEAWAVAVALAVILVAAYPAAALGQMASQTLAADAPHQIEATARGDSTVQPSVSEPPAPMFAVKVRWLADNTANETVVTLDRPVKTGDQVSIWLDDGGRVTTAPPAEADVHTMSAGLGALLWLALALPFAGLFALLRHRINHAREVRWDRGWHQLAGHGGDPRFTP